MTSGILIGGAILVGGVAVGCSDDPPAPPSTVVWTDNGTRHSIKSDATLTIRSTGDTFQFFAIFDGNGVLGIAATAHHPFSAGDYRCDAEASLGRSAAMDYNLSTGPTTNLQDCVVSVREWSDAGAALFAPFTGTFSGTAVFENGVHLITEGAFNLPTIGLGH